MNKPSLTRPKMPTMTAPTGFWKVLTVIAERVPPHQLIWLAVLLCVLVLGLGWLTYAGISRAAESKPATALAGLLKQEPVPKAGDAP
jgi:hypothetical protein